VIVAMINFTMVNLNIRVVRLDGIGLEMTILELGPVWISLF